MRVVRARRQPVRPSAGALVRFVLDSGDNLQESLHLAAGDAARDGLLEVAEMTVHASRHPAALGGRRDDERAAVGGADLARDEAPLGEPIEDARQRRSIVCESAMEIGDGRLLRGHEQCEDVRLALRQAILTETREGETDPVGRPVNRWNESQRHRRSSMPERGSCPATADMRRSARRNPRPA
jgi:hypothetical protein